MVNLTCKFCGITVNSLKSMFGHVVGKKHREMVALVAPGELEHLGRLQYFINTYMQGWPVLGLEYVEEEQVHSSYLYTCMLCDEEHNCLEMFGHLIDVEHMEKYICRHHRNLQDKSVYPTKNGYRQVLTRVALKIYKRFGHKQVVMKSSVGSRDLDTVAGAATKGDNKKNGPLPSTGDDLRTEYAQEGLPNDSGKQKKNLKQSPQGLEWSTVISNYYCNLCGVTCITPRTLYEHVMGSKHYRKMQLTVPEQLKELGSLSYFLRNQLKEIPILGLEYISELKEGPFYKFSCQLCCVELDLPRIVWHILDVDHADRYINKHHGHLRIDRSKYVKKVAKMKAFTDVAMEIVKKHGRKEIILKNSTVDYSTESKLLPQGDSKTIKAFKDKEGDTLPSEYNSESSSPARRRPSPCQELGSDESNESSSHKQVLNKSESDGPPLAKRGRLLPEDDQDALPGISKHSDPHLGYMESQMLMTSTHVLELECTTAEQELEFRTNDQFLEYLANFVIEDEEDAAFIQKITQNCIKALTNFHEEEAENQKSSHKPEAPVAHTSRTDPETPNISESKTESHSSGSEATLPKDASNPTLGIPQNKVTEIFFSSIKDMDESEVVGIFQKIATTNPEFQGMNIPAVIRYLKDSGRLKKSLCCEN